MEHTHQPIPAPQSAPATKPTTPPKANKKDQRNETFMVVVDFVGEAIRYILILMVTIAILALASGDVWIGAGALDKIIADTNTSAEWYISLATSGVLAALIILPIFGWYKRWPWHYIALATLPALIPYIFDAYFDMKFADILMYGTAFVDTTLLPADEKVVLFMLRGLMLAITTLGDPITALIIAGLPIVAMVLTNGKIERPSAASTPASAPATTPSSSTPKSEPHWLTDDEIRTLNLPKPPKPEFGWVLDDQGGPRLARKPAAPAASAPAARPAPDAHRS